MSLRRVDGGHGQLLFEIPWEVDREFRTNPEVLTSLLREQVPVLDFVQWKVVRVEPGLSESVLPLNAQSTNQHFTHQAALFVLAADYTGGIAVGSLLTGWPVVGVHPVTSPKSMSLWLLKVEIKYLRPSVGNLRVFAEVEPDRQARIQRRFLDGRPVIESVTVHFANGQTKVGEATLTYFARQSEKLRAEGVDADKTNVLYELKLTSSAELIAGVRARESGRLFLDPFAAHMAGQHGVALATRFCEKSPQLGGMVAARTRHLDRAIQEFAAAGGRDIVILGVGWDMRPFRLPLPEDTRVFELDFPTTLAERAYRLRDLSIEDPPGVTRVGIPIDLRNMPLADVLGLQLDGRSPVFIAWEGMSMYFQEAEVAKILQGMRPLLTHPQSRLWVDIVHRDAIERPEAFPDSVQAFMRGMQILGEPFTFGADSVEEYMSGQGFLCHESATSDTFLKDRQDPVYSLYHFCVASGQPTTALAGRVAPRTVRADAEAPLPVGPHQAAETPPVTMPSLNAES